MTIKDEATQMRIMPTVAVCSKCGRGFLRQIVRGRLKPVEHLVDSQPVWWLQDVEGPRCDGSIMHIDRMKQIERVHADAIDTGPQYFVGE